MDHHLFCLLISTFIIASCLKSVTSSFGKGGTKLRKGEEMLPIITLKSSCRGESSRVKFQENLRQEEPKLVR